MQLTPDLSRNVGQDAVAVHKLHPEQCVRQGLDHPSLDLRRSVIRQAGTNLRAEASQPSGRVRIMGPLSVIATVCS